MQELRAFKYNNKCELCDNILEKDKRVIIMVKKFFVLQEEVIYIFHEKITFPQYKNRHFIFLVSGLLVQWNLGILETIFHDNP